MMKQKENPTVRQLKKEIRQAEFIGEFKERERQRQETR